MSLKKDILAAVAAGVVTPAPIFLAWQLLIFYSVGNLGRFLSGMTTFFVLMSLGVALSLISYLPYCRLSLPRRHDIVRYLVLHLVLALTISLVIFGTLEGDFLSYSAVEWIGGFFLIFALGGLPAPIIFSKLSNASSACQSVLR